MLIYRTMIEYQYAEGFSMTTREIAQSLGLKSNSDVTKYVLWLVDNGYAKQKGKQNRAIQREER
jgi:predicted HTH transcriptional regulator